MTVDGGADEGTGLASGSALPSEPPLTESTPPEPGSAEVAEVPQPARPATDWERYGHRSLEPIAPPRGLQRDGGVSRRGRPEQREDLYADYRREARSMSRRATGKPSRRRANLAGFGLVFAVAVMFVVAGIVATESKKPVKTPPPTASPVATSTAAATPSAVPTPIPPITGPLAMVADLPSGVDAPDRAMPQEDGLMLYLAGDQAGLQVNTQTAEIKSRSAGYGKGIGRQVVAGGSVWRGTSWDPSSICGPSCWAKSTTYRLDTSTGKVQTKYAATYLVGYDANVVWIASSKGVQTLDPGTGSVVSTIPWKLAGEPRVGCGGLWSVNQTEGAALLRKVNASSGAEMGHDTPFGTFFYGPVQVHGRCWTMENGVGGAALPPTGFDIVDATSGGVSGPFSQSSPVVLMDGEFWTYETGGLLQRYDPAIGAYGSKLQLAVVPVIDNPFALFSAMHKLWAIDGQRLIGYDVTTGATGTGS